MSTRPQIYVIGACSGLSEALARLSASGRIEILGSSAEIDAAAASLGGLHADLVLYALEQSVFPADGLARLREHTNAPVILVASGDCSGIVDRALEAGVVDVVELPGENLAFAIRKACSRSQLQQPGTRGRVLTVFCPKGGVGKTTASVNLAAVLAKQHGKRTLLLDLDLQFGDTAFMLGLDLRETIYDLMLAPGELDADKLAGYTTRHASGVEVLPAPVQPEEADLVTENKLSRLVDVARASYDFVVVDTAPFFHGPLLPVLDRTDQLLLLCGIDVPTIKNVRLALDTLEQLHFAKERLGLLLNRPNSKAGINRHEVERALESKVRFELPADPAVLQWVNQGTPIVLGDPKANYSQAIRQLATTLAGRPSNGNKPKSRFLTRT
jgi:pilus assembly protein CpaE